MEGSEIPINFIGAGWMVEFAFPALKQYQEVCAIRVNNSAVDVLATKLQGPKIDL